MALWRRIANAFRKDRIAAEIEEELRLHLEEAVEQGRDAEEARRAFGPAIRHLDSSRDVRIDAWFDAIRSDLVFGARLLVKHRTHTVAALLSLALTIGACTAAFGLIEAVLLRPLPVASPERLYVLKYEYRNQHGKTDTGDFFEYPVFRKLRDAVSGEAAVMAIASPARSSATFDGAEEGEPVKRQYVSGTMFETFGLQPRIGRLLGPADDLRPGGHPVAVISHDYWTRRFQQDPNIPGKKVRLGPNLFEIIGVAPEGFTGTAPGSFTDIWTPTMMNATAINATDWAWFNTWVQLSPDANPERVRAKLAAAFSLDRRERSSKWRDIAQDRVEKYVQARLALEPSSSGLSGLQQNYGPAIYVLAALTALLLLIACVNIANLMLARASARSREMALRVSIGAGRLRLIRLVVIECLLLAAAAVALGAIFSRWAQPLVLLMINPPGDPVQLIDTSGTRVFGFLLLVTPLVVLLFGLAPALRASGVHPAEALRGGASTPGRARWMSVSVAIQAALCFAVSVAAAMFGTAYEHLRSDPLGFRPENLLAVELNAPIGRPDAVWDHVRNSVSALPGVESSAYAGWALLSGPTRVFGFRRDAAGQWETSPPYVLNVAPGWLETMGIPLLDGRDFRPGEMAPQVAIVNRAFAHRYFSGENPVGKTFQSSLGVVTIAGVAGDAKYAHVREPVRPVAYMPFRTAVPGDVHRFNDWATLMVRTRPGQGPALSTIRQTVAGAAAGFRVINATPQQQLADVQALRERLLATLSLFFAIVAVLLAGVGLHGVLSYSVQRRMREIGIRIALGARSHDVAATIAVRLLALSALGAIVGGGAGVLLERYARDLLFRVTAWDVAVLAPAAGVLAFAMVAASWTPLFRAIRLDPARVLRAG